MDDRELLELAARAAGMEACPCKMPKCERWFSEKGRPWNPLADDGDALRLAVKLELDIEHTNADVHAALSIPPFHRGAAGAGDDRAAATRRAIVRAAAAIGRGMAKEGER